MPLAWHKSPRSRPYGPQLCPGLSNQVSLSCPGEVTSGVSRLRLASSKANATGHGEHSNPSTGRTQGKAYPMRLHTVKAGYDGCLPINRAFFLFLATH